MTFFTLNFRLALQNVNKDYTIFSYLCNLVTKNQNQKWNELLTCLIHVGPSPYPLVGNFPHIAKKDKIVFKALHKLACEYGPMFTMWMGPKKFVVVSGVNELKVRYFLRR